MKCHNETMHTDTMQRRWCQSASMQWHCFLYVWLSVTICLSWCKIF